ncbi:MAG: ribosomal protein S18-alanine N-acetyltransferase [Desulfobulbaceae bacterium]|nr:ribosomal protein S18-alanine N-acetyltransferase [Desulfobulbaceae bacterium]
MRQTPWRVVAMTTADLPGVQLIESQSPAPWSLKQLAEELHCDRALQLVCRGEPGDQLGGFIMARLLPGEAEILKIATAREFRRQGVASLLLKSFIALTRAQGITVLHLELRAANTIAYALYKKHAFEMTGRRRNYYTAPQDDALCMTMSVTFG